VWFGATAAELLERFWAAGEERATQ
jgi:hypothetical protein